MDTLYFSRVWRKSNLFFILVLSWNVVNVNSRRVQFLFTVVDDVVGFLLAHMTLSLWEKRKGKANCSGPHSSIFLLNDLMIIYS